MKWIMLFLIMSCAMYADTDPNELLTLVMKMVADSNTIQIEREVADPNWMLPLKVLCRQCYETEHGI